MLKQTEIEQNYSYPNTRLEELSSSQQIFKGFLSLFLFFFFLLIITLERVHRVATKIMESN